MNKKIVLLATSLASALSVTVLLIVSSSNFGNLTKLSAGSEYSAVLDENNGGSGFGTSYSSSVATNQSAKTNRGSQLNISYSNAKKESGYYVNLQASNGYIYNSTILNTLTSIKVTYSGSTLALYTSATTTFGTDSTSLTSGTAVSISEGFNYFKIANSGSAASKISKVEVSYTCVPSNISYSYTKVTSNDDLTTGQYLIVYEAGNVAMNGSQTTKADIEKPQDVTIDDGEIASNSTIDSYSFTINVEEKTIQAHSEVYIGDNKDDNGTTVSTSPLAHDSISINNKGEADIIDTSAHLRYNTNSNLFRYYKSSTYTNQDAVALYKKSASSTPSVDPTPDPVDPTPDPIDPTSDTAEEIEFTITKSNSGLTTSALTSTLKKNWTLSDGETTFSATWGVGCYNDPTYDEFGITKGSSLISSSGVYVKTMTVDYYNYDNNTSVYSGTNEVEMVNVGSSSNSKSKLRQYTINSSSWKILNISTQYNAWIYSIKFVCVIDNGPKAVTGVSLNKTALTLYTDTGTTSETLVATITPTNATNQNVTWESSNEAAATVSNGVVTAVANGNTTITVRTADGGFTATCSVSVITYTHVSSVTLDKESSTITVGNSIGLTATVLPNDAVNKAITWSTNNSSVATVNNSVVTAVGVGSATITATSVDNPDAKDTFSITVNPTPVASISLDKSELSLFEGGSATLTATITPENATNKTVTWTSSNTSVATVTNGVVNAIKANENPVTITATSSNGLTATCAVKVSKSTVPVAGSEFELISSTSDLSAGEYILIGCSSKSKVAGALSGSYLSPVDATFSNNKVELTDGMNLIELGESAGAWTLKSEDGYLTSTGNKNVSIGTSSSTWTIDISSGIASLTASGSSDETLQYNASSPRFTTYNSSQTAIQLYHQSGKVNGVSLDASEIGVNVGNTYKLTASVTPANANDASVSWKSSNTSVATVSNSGLVSGVSTGTAVITVTTTDGSFEATCTVSVQSGSTIVPTSVELSDSAIELEVNGTKTLSATVYPENAADKSVTWTSSNTSVATVSNSGLVTAKANGTATITVKTTSGNRTDTCSVKVDTLAKTALKYTYDDYTANNAYDLDNCPLSGSPKLLIIPIWFTDSSTFISSSKKASVRSDIQKAYLGTNSETGWRSVKTFYEEESFGKMTLTGTVSDWYSVSDSYTTYGEDSDGALTNSLVTTASNWYFSNNTSDKRSNYDTNKDGYLDGVMLIYAAPDYSALKNENYDNLWAYCYWLQNGDANTSSPTPNVFFWASYDFMYGSNANSRAGSSYNSGDSSHCTIDAHTFIHEMGHVLGLDDYYDYGSNNYTPAGGFSMQDYNVGGHDPFSVMAYGWANPYIPKTSMTITIGDFQSTHDIILLANHSVDSPFDEYLLLELFTPTGLNELDCTYQYASSPKGPSTVGIRLWHVDARLTYYDNANDDTPSTSLVTNPTVGLVEQAFTNTVGKDGYGSPLGTSYEKYDLLHLVRNNTSTTYKVTSDLSSSDLFVTGNEFTTSKYSKQFVDGEYMDNGNKLGWSFTVVSIANNKATIQLTKA